MNSIFSTQYSERKVCIFDHKKERCGKGLKSTDKTIVYLKILPIHNSYICINFYYVPFKTKSYKSKE